ncbi:MAG TPA: hypothetical protein VFI45_06045 [Candidatus Acidoferrum sp.]|nr:hypothetical protein [Candidatus Acidoferrum sp.]
MLRCTLPLHIELKEAEIGKLDSAKTKEGEGEDMEELTIDAAICSDYERLLKDSQRGLVAWRERSEEVVRFGLKGKSVGDELQKLQADYATAYHRLEQHGKTCILCQFTIGLTESVAPSAVFISPRRELPA